MNERIDRLVKATRSGEIFPAAVPVEYDEFDLNLADPLRIAKRQTGNISAWHCMKNSSSNDPIIYKITTYSGRL